MGTPKYILQKGAYRIRFTYQGERKCLSPGIYKNTPKAITLLNKICAEIKWDITTNSLKPLEEYKLAYKKKPVPSEDAEGTEQVKRNKVHADKTIIELYDDWVTLIGNVSEHTKSGWSLPKV